MNEESMVHHIHASRIKQAQGEEAWVKELKDYMQGRVAELDDRAMAGCEKQAGSYEVVDDLLYYVGRRKVRGEQTDEPRLRLVVPTTLRTEILHHYHRSLAYERVKRFLFWRGQYQDVRDYVAACSDCQSGK